MSGDDEADGARLKADAADGVAEDDGARLKADAQGSKPAGGALLRGGRPSSGDGGFRLRMEGSGRSWGVRSTANGCSPIMKNGRRAGVGTRSAMALYADLADYIASADNAYAHA